MTEITDVKGVGDGNVDDLADVGIETAEELRDAPVEQITDAKGFGEATADKVKGAAEDLLGEDETEDDVESEPEETVVNNAGNAVNGQPVVLDYELSDIQRYHILSGLTSLHVDTRQQRRAERNQAVTNAIEEVRTDGQIALGAMELNFVDMALRQEEQEHRGIRGLDGFVAELREVKGEVRELRRELINTE